MTGSIVPRVIQMLENYLRLSDAYPDNKTEHKTMPEEFKTPHSAVMLKFYELPLADRLKLLENAIYLDSIGHHAGNVVSILMKLIEFIGIDETPKQSPTDKK